MLRFALLVAGLTRSSAQYCTSGATNAADSNPGDVVVSGKGTLVFSPPCPGTTGLDDRTALQVLMKPGGNYSMIQQWSTCGGAYSGVGSVWIDFNSNQLFEENELVAAFSGSPTQTRPYTIPVPVGAVPGPTRMRVLQREGSSLPLTPCGTFTWGGAIDFTVNIVSAGPTPPPTPGQTLDVAATFAYGPGLETQQTIAGVKVFTVQGIDTDGNLMRIGGAQWTMKLIGLDNGAIIDTAWTDNNTGAYTARFTIQKAGRYILAIGEASTDMQITGSPFSIDFIQ